MIDEWVDIIKHIPTAQQFGKKRSEKDSKYAQKKRDVNPKKFQQNVDNGYRGECVLFEIGPKYGMDVNKPSSRVVSPAIKSFGSDLADGVFEFNSKTACEYNGDISWIVQWNNTSGYGGRDTSIFDSKSSRTKLLALTELNYPSKIRGRIRAIIPVAAVHAHGLLEEPDKRKNEKRAIYLSSIMERCPQYTDRDYILKVLELNNEVSA